ncbi:hypothetical protein BH09VER1_BH09VER1_48390 [soil metagenome]
MKKLLALVLMMVPLLARAEDTRVASYYLNNPEKFDGQKITLNCSYVKRGTENSAGGAMAVFRAYTASKNNNSFQTSEITVHVPIDVAEKFVHKYGSDTKYDYNYNYSTRPMTGIFKKDGSSCFLEYTPST